MGRILLVDDDQELCAMLIDYLRAEGFDPHAVHDGETGVHAALEGDCEAIVMDVMMPGLSGIDALRLIRGRSDVPVLMLTARGDDIDRVVGLELGADDYLPKPCLPRELVARLRAILRRTTRAEPVERSREPLLSGPLELLPDERQARWHGTPLELTGSEFHLLEALVRAAGRVMTKNELSERVLGRPHTAYDRSVDVHLSNLRQKLAPHAGTRETIRTVRGVGYKWMLG